jgi:hypothetical protein
MTEVYDLDAYRAIVKGVQEFFLQTQANVSVDIYCQHDISHNVDISCKHDDARSRDNTISLIMEEYAMPPKGWRSGRPEGIVKAVRLSEDIIERIARYVEYLQAQLPDDRINEGVALRRLIRIGLDTVEASASPPQPAPTPQPALPIALEGVPASQAQPLAPISTAEAQPPAKRKGGRPSTKRQPILALLREHPEGLTAEQIRAYLDSPQPIGDTLAGMRRSGVVKTEGTGHAMRYFAILS